MRNKLPLKNYLYLLCLPASISPPCPLTDKGSDTNIYKDTPGESDIIQEGGDF